MSSFLDALQQRIASPETTAPAAKLRINLNPAAAARLAELRAEQAELRTQTQASGAKVKMNGRAATITTDITATEDAVAAATGYVWVRALTPEEIAPIMADVTPEDLMAKRWRAELAAGFVRAEDSHGQPVDGLTRDIWSAYLETISAAELATCHSRLEAAITAAVDPS